VSQQALHLGSKLDSATLESLAEFICGDDDNRFPVYRSSTYLTRFFEGLQLPYTHDGSTRKWWVLSVLEALQPNELERVILRLVDLREYRADKTKLALAAESMNTILAMDGFGIDFNGTTPVLVRAQPLTVTQQDLLEHRSSPPEADQFLSKQFSDDIRIEDLHLDPVITPILQARVDEARACPRDKVPLGTIFLLGSTLEGILIGTALKDTARFATAKAAPRDRSGAVLKVHDWKLAALIDVAHELGVLNLDVKKFSHALRDFRNYIHPYHQMSSNFSPDQHTVDICWQVFKAALAQLKAGDVGRGA
jgi:hypothetical protein